MNIKEKAKQFAIHVHNGQIRKNEPDKPMIMHPISVGNILEKYGYDDNVIAAGYLHDVVEDSKYTIEDIEKKFGNDIANLVNGDTEPDKSLSWEDRKQYTINKIKELPLRSRAIISADKIDNLTDLLLIFEKTGERDFSNFKRGEDSQKWYYTTIYKALIENQDEKLPIFQELKTILDKVFHEKENDNLKDTIFKDNQEYYQKLKQLHAMKQELLKLKNLAISSKPFIIEFSGTPRTGKTTLINNLYDFFKKGGFDVLLLEEFTTSKYYKEEFKKKFPKMSSNEGMTAIIEEVEKQLKEAILLNKDIIIIDRSINDRQIWNYRNYLRGSMDETTYYQLKDKYLEISKELIDALIISYADPFVSLQRDYLNSLALEERNFLNLDNIKEYNNSLMETKMLLEESTDKTIFLDTTSITMQESSTKVAEELLPVMRKKYIKTFKDNYHIIN